MLVIVSRTEGEGSGAETVLNHLLSNWKQPGRITVITATGSSVARVAKKHRIKTIEVAFRPKLILKNLAYLEKIIAQIQDATQIHAWNAKSYEISWYLSLRLRIPLTCTSHDHPDADFFTKRKKLLLKFVANRSQKIVCVSENLKRECIKYGYTSPIEIIRNGLPTSSSAQLDIENSSKSISLGFLGMGSNIKGFEIAAQWIERTVDNTNIKWKLFGDIHPDYNRILSELKARNYSNFTLLGRRNTEDIFKEIDLLIHCSSKFDPLPTVLIEAAQNAIPAIASRNGGADEIVIEGKTGLLFYTVDTDHGLSSILALTNNPAIMKSMGNNAKSHFLANFRIERMISQYEAFWNA